jgi:hypothetical protein
MRRRTFDVLASAAGLLIAAVLIVAGALMTWGYTFVNGQVSSQLTAQKIVFPAPGSPALTALPAADKAAMTADAGQLMTSGGQAQTYADHFIAVHLREIGGGKTYSQLSAASLADPKNTALAGQVQTLFRGEALRGLLLNAYAFWKIGQILLIAAICAFTAGALMLILAVLGFAHWRRARPDAELFSPSDRTAGQAAGR